MPFDASQTGDDIVSTHRRDLSDLRSLKQRLAGHVHAALDCGKDDDDPSPFSRSEGCFDALEKLSRIEQRLIAMERQAWALDADTNDTPQPIEVDLSGLSSDTLNKVMTALNGPADPHTPPDASH